MRKRIPAVILMFALFLSTSFAANAYKKSIEVEYGISVIIYMMPAKMTDVTGKTVEPFVYQGTTYVPIRAVAENMGAIVSYNSDYNWAMIETNKDDQIYLHYLSQAAVASNTIQGYNMTYYAMTLSKTNLQGRFYSTLSNIVKLSHDYMLSEIENSNPHYSKAREVDSLLSDMLSAFSDLEDAYYNSNKSTFEERYEEISNLNVEIVGYIDESQELTF